MQSLQLERAGLNADSYLATIEGRDVETGVVGRLDEDYDFCWRVGQVYHTVTYGVIVVAYDFSRIEIDADDVT